MTPPAAQRGKAPGLEQIARGAMSEAIEQLCQQIVDARGYLVLGFTKEVPVGYVTKNIVIGGFGRSDEARAVVVGKASEKEWRDQHRIIGVKPVRGDGTVYFYRVIAE